MNQSRGSDAAARRGVLALGLIHNISVVTRTINARDGKRPYMCKLNSSATCTMYPVSTNVRFVV